MYQFSMKYYRELFVKSFGVSGDSKVKEIKGRVRQLKSEFLKVLYSNVCRSLFEKHKLMFAFNMAIKVHLDDGHSSGDEKRDLFNKKLKELEMMNHHPTSNNYDKS
jgi:dynein heavy chain